MINMDESPTAVFVGGLPFDTQYEEARDFFANAGPIKKFYMKFRNGRDDFTGVVFITYTNHEDAQKAVDMFNDGMYKDHKLQVNFLKHKEKAKMQFGYKRTRFDDSPKIYENEGEENDNQERNDYGRGQEQEREGGEQNQQNMMQQQQQPPAQGQQPNVMQIDFNQLQQLQLQQMGVPPIGLPNMFYPPIFPMGMPNMNFQIPGDPTIYQLLPGSIPYPMQPGGQMQPPQDYGYGYRGNYRGGYRGRGRGFNRYHNGDNRNEYYDRRFDRGGYRGRGRYNQYDRNRDDQQRDQDMPPDQRNYSDRQYDYRQGPSQGEMQQYQQDQRYQRQGSDQYYQDGPNQPQYDQRNDAQSQQADGEYQQQEQGGFLQQSIGSLNEQKGSLQTSNDSQSGGFLTSQKQFPQDEVEEQALPQEQNGQISEQSYQQNEEEASLLQYEQEEEENQNYQGFNSNQQPTERLQVKVLTNLEPIELDLSPDNEEDEE